MDSISNIKRAAERTQELFPISSIEGQQADTILRLCAAVEKLREQRDHYQTQTWDEMEADLERILLQEGTK